MMLRRTCVDDPAVGGFDERLGSYHEDVDLCLRASRAGWRVAYVPTARLTTLGSVTSDVSYWTERNTILLAGKHGGVGPMARAVVWVAGLAARTLASGLAPWRSKERRAESRRFYHLHLRALRDVAAAPATARSMLREHAAARAVKR